MRRSRLMLLGWTLGTALPGLAAARADNVTLDVSPGLWEVTTAAPPAGQMKLPDDMLAKLSPELRAKVEAAMQAAQSPGLLPHKFRECVTAQQIRDGLDLGLHQQADCQRSVLGSTPRQLDLREECTGRMPRTVTAHIAAADRDTVHGTVQVQMSHSGTPGMAVSSAFEAHRLGADCGGLAPGRMERE